MHAYPDQAIYCHKCRKNGPQDTMHCKRYLPIVLLDCTESVYHVQNVYYYAQGRMQPDVEFPVIPEIAGTANHQ